MGESKIQAVPCEGWGIQQGASSSEDRALAKGEAAVPASSSLRDRDPSRGGQNDKVVIYHIRDQQYWLAEGRGMTAEHQKAHLYDRSHAEFLVRSCHDDGEPSSLELRDPWSFASGIETEGQNPKGSGAKHESPIAESEVPASIDQEDIHIAVVGILDWMMCEGLMRHRTAEDDGLKIESIIRSALSLPSPQDQESRTEANGGGEAPGRDDGWQSIEMAPANTEVEIRAGFMTFRAKLVPDAGMSEDDHLCDQWQATREGEHPPCWSDGACWGSNADHCQSMQPEAWRHLPETASPLSSQKEQGE